MKKKRIVTGLLVLVFCLFQCMTVFAAETAETTGDQQEMDTGGNLFWGGENLSVDSVFSAFAAGRTVEMDQAQAEGSVFAVAQDIDIRDSRINESAFLGGETVTVRDTPVHGNIFAMGRTIDISGESNTVYAMGETVAFNGVTNGIHATGNSVSIAGKINGDVTVESDSLFIDPDAEITGRLKITAGSEPQIPDSAKVGSYEFEQKVEEDDKSETEAVAETVGSVMIKKVLSTIYWIIAISLLGLLLCWLFDDHLLKAGEKLKKSPGYAVARGLLGWICAPIIVIFMLCTVLLAPAGVLLLLAYIILLCAGTCFTGASLGRLLFPKMNRFLAAVICISVLEVMLVIPFAGRIIGVICDLYLISYVVGCLSESVGSISKNKPQAAGSAAAADPVQVTETVSVSEESASVDENVSEESASADEDAAESTEESKDEN